MQCICSNLALFLQFGARCEKCSARWGRPPALYCVSLCFCTYWLSVCHLEQWRGGARWAVDETIIFHILKWILWTFLVWLSSCHLLYNEIGLLWQGELKAIDPATGLLQCQYTSDIATGLAAGALIFLILAQSFIMIVTRCLCCGSGYKPGAARTFGVLMFIISWWVLLDTLCWPLENVGSSM